MGNQSCAISSVESGSVRIKAKRVAAGSRSPGCSRTLRSDSSMTSLHAADAELLRRFTESLSTRFSDLSGASAMLGVSGGSCIGAGAFEQALRSNLGYSSSTTIMRILNLLDAHNTGVISEFEIAQLFTAPVLVRSLERQLKGKVSSPFVAFNHFRPTGDGFIGLTDFKDVLEQFLGYSDATLMETLFNTMDLDGDGNISFSEFVIFWNCGYPAPYGFYEPPSNREVVQSTVRSWPPSCSRGSGDLPAVPRENGASTRASMSCRSMASFRRSSSGCSDCGVGARSGVDRLWGLAAPQ